MSPDTTGVILAGGRATRMGGEDKGLVKLQGKPLFIHILEKLRPQVSHLLISANRNIDIYSQHQQVVADITPDFAGPLAGMLAALKISLTEWVVFVPCDVPDFPDDLVSRLWQGKKQALAAYADDGARAHPTLALLHRSLAPQLEAFLENGDRKLMLFLSNINAVPVIFADRPNAFKNLNTPEDIATWHPQTGNE
ncbi:molybdenum cofactor guanylyltransferase MobA [Edaphovirga cremea]|uniref:molybdenum cofactor guanylyltransferase MobA n=1 Tax=Edaphovirga cremea TaxID=2267246 RepID=UPI003989AEC5